MGKGNKSMNKKLVGGDYLLDLTPITIEKSDDGNYTNITNKDVLAQLTNLKKYVKNPMMVKPVWVRFKNGETDELVVARGTFAVVDTGEFEICIFADGYKLKLHIEFTQAELEDHTPIDDWYIDTNDAKFIFTSDYKRFVVEDVKNIDGNVLSTLQCGDVVIKHDESGEHSYVVSFKSETGICLTYADASVIETQSYDYVDGTGWVYNSEDKSGNLIEDVKPVYYHPINIRNPSYPAYISLVIIDNEPNAYTKETFLSKISNFDRLCPLSGAVYSSAKQSTLICAYAYKGVGNIFYVLGVYTNGYAEDSTAVNLNEIINLEATVFNDGVNKIN